MTGHDDDQESPIGFFRIVFTSEPADVVGVLAGQAVFAVTVLSQNPAALTYQWSCAIDGGGFFNLTETAGFYEGVATPTLTVKALDNFLASRSSVQFKCQVVFGNILAGYSTPATLTIPLHTSWTPKPMGIGSANWKNTATIALDGSLLPSAVGFAGPYTYLWANTGGTVFGCSDVTLQNPTFSYHGLPADVIVSSIWTCTISNGATTKTTDPIYLFAVFSVSGTTVTAPTQTTPYQVGRNEAMLGANFQAPWTVLASNKIRCLAGSATPVTPNAASTQWVSSTFLYGGQYADVFVGYPYTIGATASACLGVVLLPPDNPI